MVAMFLDITERKRMEEGLRESTARLQTVFDSSPLAITVTDLDGTIADCSRAALDAYGFASKSDVLGHSVLEFIAARYRADATAKMAELLAGGRVRDIDYTLVRKDGTEFPGELSGSLMRDHDGRPLGFVGISVDITERKKAEQERLDHHRRLRSLASELSLAEERERRRIATGLHDHACEALILSRMKLEGLRECLPAGPATDVAGIYDSLDRAVQSARELMFDLSSPTLHKFGLEAALQELLEDKVRTQHGIHCTFSNDGAPKPSVEDVRVLLFQSVRELLINIIKHAQACEVMLDVARLDDSLRITVADDGVGFDVDGVVLVPSRSRGFGLFNIRERLAYVGGSLEMWSRSGQGSRFTLVARLDAQTKVVKESHVPRGVPRLAAVAELPLTSRR
jgi:PAS domain S-box-containing protein